MYQVCIKKDFIAQHFLIGGDFGAENLPHPHDYSVEVVVDGPMLNQHGYLVDIDALKKNLDIALAPYAGQMLNDSPYFGDKNPSLEHFSAILAHRLAEEPMPGVSSLKVKLWEDKFAYASYELIIN